MVSKIRTNPFMHKPTNCRAGMGGSRFLFMFYPPSTKQTGKAIIAAQQELEDMPRPPNIALQLAGLFMQYGKLM